MGQCVASAEEMGIAPRKERTTKGKGSGKRGIRRSQGLPRGTGRGAHTWIKAPMVAGGSASTEATKGVPQE
eukprot:5568540-Pyramimonas_sp.AAC.1